MAGITGFGAYVPWHRMSAGTTKGWSSSGERSVANFDEDSITMAVAAARNMLGDGPRKGIEALYFASTTSPYKGKSNAGIVAVACDLPINASCMDFCNSPKAGTSALKAAVDAVRGTRNQVLVAASDLRVPQPRSQFETTFGDGAVALLIGETDVIAELEDCCSESHEIIDTWREDGDKFLRSWEDRFVAEEGYLKLLPQAVSGLLRKHGLGLGDIAKAVLYAPDARRHREMVKALGFDPKTQVQDPMLNSIGNTGVSSALMTLASALDEAKPGDRILLANYGDGADAFIFRVTEAIKTARKARRNLRHYLGSKKTLPDYEMYLTWRGLLEKAPAARRPALRAPSPAAMLREVDKNLRLYGTKCAQCGYPQYPPQSICTCCHTRDSSEPYGFADKRAQVFTYTLDTLAPTLDPPTVVAVIDFEGGGRMFSIMTDRDPAAIEVGTPVEMTFRSLYLAEGIRNYFWKSTPSR